MNEKEKWLEETGYEIRHYDGLYVFEYRKGNYAAFNTFEPKEVIEAPLGFLKKVHEIFLEKAKKQEIF